MVNDDKFNQVIKELEALSDDELDVERDRLRREIHNVDDVDPELTDLKLLNSYYVALDRASTYFRRLYGIPPSVHMIPCDTRYEIIVRDDEAAHLKERIFTLLGETATGEICQSDYPGEWDLYESLLNERYESTQGKLRNPKSVRSRHAGQAKVKAR